MTVEQTLRDRSGSSCELCGAAADVAVYAVPPHADDNADHCILICSTCREQIEHPDTLDVHHWRCLNDSMWSQVPAVQVMAWRLLKRLDGEAWAQDALDMLYLDEDTHNWAKEGVESDNSTGVTHLDSNGAVLSAGDTVILVKDLDVKGANFTAKRGTAVRGISLVADNPEHIEGRVEGQRIVILTKFVKKSK